MTLRKVHTRLLIAGAWLLGTATATGGCLWATAHLDQGILGPASHQLTVAAVNRILASETAEPSASPASPPASGAPDPSPSPLRTGAASPSAAGTLLSSSGGSVVATCGTAGAYLVSWSPQQGYEAVSVVRGPAAPAKVVFQSSQTAVTMVVTCQGGTPTGSTSVSQAAPGDD